MNDTMPMTKPSSEYGNIDGLPDNWKKFLQENHDELTANQLQQACDYLSKCCSNFRNSLNENITIEDFEKVKKEDMDGDNGQGEKSGY